MKSKTRKITIRFSVEEDTDLLAWYDSLRGRKGEKIKDVLRQKLSLTEKEETSQHQLDAGSLLADIRQIVDAAITGAFEEYALPSEKKTQAVEEDTEAENLLDALINNSRIELEDDAPEPEHEGWGNNW